jgi:hypothetical protein
MFVIGVDLGQAVDYSAIAVIELGLGQSRSQTLDLRHIERVPLGESYTAVVDRLAALNASLPDSRLVMDATGVGRPVRDMLIAKGVEPVAVSITSGRETRCVDGIWRVPKRELLRGLCVALESGLLRIAEGLPYTAALKAELGAFQAAFTNSGNVKFNGVSEHDDLVIAVALAVTREPG